MRRLTPDEICSYDRNGFLEIADFFPVRELQALNDEIDRLRDATKTDGPSGAGRNSILQLGLRSPLMQKVCEDERILTLIESMVKPGIAIYSAKMVEKLPYDEAVCHWHQDEAYYRKNSISPCRMSIWLPLQDCDEENGCIWMVPGSHRRGLRSAYQIETGKTGHCALGFAPGETELTGAIPIRARRGSIILFHALTWHRSLGNQTRQHRRAFIVSYQDALAPRGNGAQHKILRGAF